MTFLILIGGLSSVVEKQFDDVEVSALGGDVKRRGVGQLVPRRDDEVLVELHQLLDHRDGALARGDVGASAAVFRGHGDLLCVGKIYEIIVNCKNVEGQS